MDFSPHELWASTGTPVRLVILVMFIMVFWCMYIAVERLVALGKARRQSRALAAAIGEHLQSNDREAALDLLKREEFSKAYLGHMLTPALTEFDARPDRYGVDTSERAMERIAINESESLNKGLNILATTGATAPFVGLVGTIFGIINAFSGMAESGGGGLGAVSAGIAEALVTTAIGITVAIVGVWLFNFFTAKIEAITNDMSVSAQEFLDWALKQTLPPFVDDAK